jgi:predicted metalloprotease with PDZ domain
MNTYPITYTVAMPQPHTHLYTVTLEVAGLHTTMTDFVLPSWTPGSYLIRDYARHIQAFSAEAGGTPLHWYKTAKDCWRVEHGNADTLHIHYLVYAYELTVRTSHLDASHGYFNGTTLFMYMPERTAAPLWLQVEVPGNWLVTTGLAHHSITQKRNCNVWTFHAADYDELVDSPVECGTHRLLTFEVDSVEHRIALWGHGNEDEARLVADTRKIVETNRRLFGSLPYRTYTFILHLANGWGGLEHRNSVTNLVDRWTFQPERSYERFLGLQSHEFFHVWNVKRIRAAPLGPFDYRRENYTRQLWAMEGVTSYYDNLNLVRAGLLTPERYLALLTEDMLALQRRPGRALHSLEQSSFDAWIKLYRPDENSDNTTVSYYLKGSLVTLLLDMELRLQSGGTRSFDDVLRYLAEHYPITGPGIPEAGGYLAAIEAVAEGANGAYRTFFERYITGTDELDYARAFAVVGIVPRWGYTRTPRAGGTPAWLGMRCRSDHGHTLVASVRSDGPAFRDGISAHDELLALDGMRIDEGSLTERLAEHRPGDVVTLSLFRRDELMHVPVTLTEAPYDDLRLERVEHPDAMQEQHYRAWLWLG